MTLDYEKLLITNELSEVIRFHNQALERLRAYRVSYPYLIAPNLASMLEENLKENVQVLYREYGNLHKPKTEQRRHVCAECHGVFQLSLRGGICDQCRAKKPSVPIDAPAQVAVGGDGASGEEAALVLRPDPDTDATLGAEIQSD